MPADCRLVSPTADPRVVRTQQGELLTIPADWELLPPGDAGLTRRVKLAGPTWLMQEKRGRKLFSRGLYAASQTIAGIRADLEAERATEAYARKMQGAANRRERVQQDYVTEFETSVLQFLRFADCYQEFAAEVARRVTLHATPVGSGTVARTARIPVEQRAESAVIAWLRHQTTAYDNLQIPRIKGKRREVRRQLAAQSRDLLEKYRWGIPVDRANCPLQQALMANTTGD